MFEDTIHQSSLLNMHPNVNKVFLHRQDREFNDILWQMDGVMDKWTNPQIHYCPENDFFKISLSILKEKINFFLIVKVHKSTLNIAVILHSEICNRILIF